MKYDPYEQLQRLVKGLPESQIEARTILLEMGAHAVPYVCEAITGFRERPHPLLLTGELWRLVTLLAELEDLRGIPTLLRLAQQTRDIRVPRLVRRLLDTVERRTDPQDIPALLELLRLTHPAGSADVLWWEISGQERVRLATVLVARAERAPRPELREALPLLKPDATELYLLLVYSALRKRLQETLATEDLPIPATPSNLAEDLPVPSANKTSDASG